MGRIRYVFVTLMLGGTALACGPDVEGERNVRVDYRHDEFASHFWRFFPTSIAVHPGETVEFEQQWTGEPHTVTMGTRVEQALAQMTAVEEKYADVPDDPAVLQQAEAEYEAAKMGLPFPDPYTETDAFQNALQPCYLDSGGPPSDPGTPCPKDKQRQPEFTGRQSFYNSGFIPFEGDDGNRFRVKLADDIKPGTYRFVCVLHMPDMQGSIEVKAEGTELPSVTERNRDTRREIERLANPLRDAFRAMGQGTAKAGDEVLRPPLAGYHSGEEYTVAVDEFVPRTIRTKVGEPVRWTMVGAHTISFDVPEYVPVFNVGKGGLVRRDSRTDEPAGGSPPIPEVDFTSGTPPAIDAGTWDGSGFFSSGLLAGEPYATYTLRFSEPGTYEYACLIHPPMVGKVVVSA